MCIRYIKCNASKNPNRQIRISICDSAPFTQHRKTFRSIRHGITSTGDRIYAACSTWNASTARLSNIKISHTTSRRNTHDIRNNNNTGAIAVDNTRFKQATNSNPIMPQETINDICSTWNKDAANHDATRKLAQKNRKTSQQTKKQKRLFHVEQPLSITEYNPPNYSTIFVQPCVSSTRPYWISCRAL